MAKLESASTLFEDFTGHKANYLETINTPKGGVFLKVGTCDFLLCEQGKIRFKLVFTPKQALLIVPYTAKSFDIIGKDIYPDKSRLVIKGIVKIKAIAYTTKRDGVIEKYIHHFKPKACPSLDYLTRQHIRSSGGRFDFTELGFVDHD